ncbi:MAG: hypothetical protein HGA98_01195, partial [Deltaproteobacteria bacterium]|nr:hypothetical protein [Deltaproteobacteria bacterium]
TVSPSPATAEVLPKDLKESCRALEEAFATIVFRKMQETMVPKSSKGAAAFARDTTQGLLTAQWAHLASQGEGLGLWRVLYRQLAPSEVKPGGENADVNSLEMSVSRDAPGRGRGLERVPSRSSEAAQAAAAAAAGPSVPERRSR